jgi:pimeloyl-ACP methyl ester carboxylesterase
MRRLCRSLAALLAAAPLALGQDQPPRPAPASPPPPTEAPPPPPPPPRPQPEPEPTKITPAAHVEVRGNGPVPMVLVPGLLLDWRIYDSFMERNASRYTMYALTLPGFAGSNPPPVPPDAVPPSQTWWQNNAARAVWQVIEEHKLERPVLVGHVMGGQVAMRVAAEHPGAIRALVLLNALPAYPLGGLEEPVMAPQERRRLVDEEVSPGSKAKPDAAWKWEQRNWLQSSTTNAEVGKRLADEADSTPRPIAARYLLEFLASDVTEAFGKLSIPVLVCASIPELPGIAKEDMRGLWRNAYKDHATTKVAFFEDSQELLTVEAPAELDRAVEQFLAGQPVEGKPAARPDMPPGPPPGFVATPAPPPSPAPAPQPPPKPAEEPQKPQAPAPSPQPRPESPHR